MLIPVKPETSEETRQKLRELILYISERCEFDPHYGATKLNKIVLFVDVLSYLRYGISITGTQYMKEKYGPVPVHMIQILDEMSNNKEIVIKTQRAINYSQKRVIPLREANIDPYFLPRDIALIEEVIQDCFQDNAKSISAKSHGIAWKFAEIGEIIPYEAFLIADDQSITDEDINEAQNLIKRYGWEIYATP
jgi:hypothetical protein